MQPSKNLFCWSGKCALAPLDRQDTGERNGNLNLISLQKELWKKAEN
jgi:hypothetical protein